MPIHDLDALRQRIHRFAQEREWESFHTPKNLACALSVEASELLEIFQWLTDQEAVDLLPEQRQRVAEEMADVLVYLVRLADVLEVDLLKACERKMAQNAAKYPAERVRGSAKKYTEY